MSAQVDQFCDTLRDQLNAVDDRLQSVKANLDALPEQAEKAVRTKLAQARANLQTQKDSMEQTRANLKARAAEQIAETKETVNQWKAKHETRKLQARAEFAEAYAADAIAFATAAIDEAEEAILHAVVARMDADTVQ